MRANLAHALTGLAQIERDLGNTNAALRLYEEADPIYRAENDLLRLAHTVRHVADIHQDMGQLDLAEPHYHEALNIYRSHKETPPLDLANAVRGLALLKSESGNTEEARRLWQEARDLYAAVNVEAGVKESTRRLAMLPPQKLTTD
jgi:tetratricopeptide (TPR) repeat protein